MSNKALLIEKAHDIEALMTKDQNTESPLLANQLLSRYGIKNATALKTFLDSIAGKTLKSLVEKKLSELASLHQNAQRSAQENKKQRAIVMAILGLVYEKKAAAEHRKYTIAQQQLDAKLHPEQSTHYNDELSIESYQASAIALQDMLAEREAIMRQIDGEWDALDLALEQLANRDKFFAEVLVDLDRLFHVSPKEEQYLQGLHMPALQHVFQSKQIIHKDGKNYLVASNVDFNTLTNEEKNIAEKDYNSLKLKLERAVHTTQRDQQAQHDKIKMDLIKRTTQLHQEIRVITQQLLLMRLAIDTIGTTLKSQSEQRNQLQLALKLTPSQIENQNTPTRTLFLSYKMLHKEALRTTSDQEAAPIVKTLREDIDPLDLETLNRSGAPQFLPELHQFKQGANNLTSAAQTQRQTLLSLLKNAESLAALVSESPTARRFHLQEQKNIPTPTQTTVNEKQTERDENKENIRFNPTPLNTHPYKSS